MYLIPQRFDCQSLQVLHISWGNDWLTLVCQRLALTSWETSYSGTRSSHLFSSTPEVSGALETCSKTWTTFHALAHRSHQSLLRIFREKRHIRNLPWCLRGRDVILWQIGATNHCSGSSEISYSGVEELSFSLSTTQRPRALALRSHQSLLRIFKAFPPMQSFALHGRDTPSLLLLTTTHVYMGYTDLNKTRGRVPKNALFDNER